LHIPSFPTRRSSDLFQQEKFVQQPVHLKQPFAIEQHLIAFDGKEAPVFQSLQRFGETSFRIDAELISEIREAEVAEFELQNKLANQPLVVGRRERAVDRQLALMNLRDVRIE